VIVVDSSAWIEFFRKTESSVHLGLRRLIEDDVALAVTEVVVMEVLAGALSSADRASLRARLLALPVLPLRGLSTWVSCFQGASVSAPRYISD